MPAADTPPRRKRFQFSLRTLMLCVLAYCVLWLITIKWGGARLAEEYAKTYSDHLPKIGADGHSVVLTKYNASRVANYDYYRAHAIAPAPFVILWRWEFKSGDAGTYEPIEKVGGNYLWFFGFRKGLGRSKDPVIEELIYTF